MAIHEEKVLSPWITVLILAAAFLICYPFWEIGLRELFRDEGEYAAIAREIAAFPPETLAHGELMPYSYPLYPLLAKGVSSLGFSMEFSLRFLSVFSLAVLAVIVGIACYTMIGIQAAAAGAAVMFATLLSADKAVEGYPHMLTVLLIYSGWLLWFYFGQVRLSWNRAWLFAGLFAGLAFYNSGWMALIYFYLPMAFLRRPFTVWSKLKKPGFFGGCAWILFFFFLWLVPRWENAFNVTVSLPTLDFSSYLWQLIYTPVDIAIRFIPWAFFLYAPFCVALFVLDKNPLFTRYLRLLFYVTLILLWVNPLSKGRDILFLAPALATLAGMNYWIVVRRHGDNLCRLAAFASILLFLTGAGALVFLLLPPEMFLRIPWGEELLGYKIGIPFSLMNLIETSGILVMAVAAYVLAVRRKQVWVILLLIFCGMMLFFWSVMNPVRAAEHVRRDIGGMIRQAIGPSFTPEMVIYKDAAISGLYPEGYYIGTKIRTLNLSDTSLVKAPELFLITTSSVQPADTSRVWVRIFEVIYKKQNLYIWKGRINDRSDEQERNDFRNIRF